MGYSSAPLYQTALAEYRQQMPGQAAAYDALFVDPRGSAPAPAPAPTYNPPQSSEPQYSELDQARMMNVGNRGILDFMR